MEPRLHRRRLTACAAAVSALLLLGGCLPGGDPGEGRSESSSTTSGSESEGSETEELVKPEQQQVDAPTAKRALPSRSDMPDKTWMRDISESSEIPAYSPKECAATRLSSDAVQDFKKKHRTVEQAARFSQAERDGGRIMAVFIESYDRPFPISYFDEAGKSMAQCERFTQTYKGSEPTAITASAIATPALGDRSFGIRVTTPRVKPVDRLYVRSGHNLIIVMYLGQKDSLDVDLLEKRAQDVLDGLKKS